MSKSYTLERVRTGIEKPWRGTTVRLQRKLRHTERTSRYRIYVSVRKSESVLRSDPHIYIIKNIHLFILFALQNHRSAASFNIQVVPLVSDGKIIQFYIVDSVGQIQVELAVNRAIARYFFKNHVQKSCRASGLIIARFPKVYALFAKRGCFKQIGNILQI